MNRLQRLHALSERLRAVAPETVSTRTLANDFDVSRRTIERDLEAFVWPAHRCGVRPDGAVACRSWMVVRLAS